MNKVYALGVDVGSTTVKTVILDENKQIIYSKYERHFSKVKETVKSQLEIIAKEYPDAKFRLSITGSAGLGLATASFRRFSALSSQLRKAIPMPMLLSNSAVRTQR